MSGFLLDTNVISLFASGRSDPPAAFVAWMTAEGEADTLYLSAMTIAEIEKGLRSLHRRGGVERAKRIHHWLEGILTMFGAHVLPMDAIVARVAGAVEDDATARGRHPGLGDVIIAATAKAYDLTLITQNVKHFSDFDIAVVTPADIAAEVEKGS